MTGVLRALVLSYTDDGSADADRMYIFGGSMGGTGTWTMLSTCPELFAAAMPVAGNRLAAMPRKWHKHRSSQSWERLTP